MRYIAFFVYMFVSLTSLTGCATIPAHLFSNLPNNEIPTDGSADDPFGEEEIICPDGVFTKMRLLALKLFGARLELYTLRNVYNNEKTTVVVSNDKIWYPPNELNPREWNIIKRKKITIEQLLICSILKPFPLF